MTNEERYVIKTITIEVTAPTSMSAQDAAAIDMAIDKILKRPISVSFLDAIENCDEDERIEASLREDDD